MSPPKPVAPEWLGDHHNAGLTPKQVHRNLSVPELIEKALHTEEDTRLMSTGALAATSGDKTGACDNHLSMQCSTYLRVHKQLCLFKDSAQS